MLIVKKNLTFIILLCCKSFYDNVHVNNVNKYIYQDDIDDKVGFRA